ncbi:hypothetical protein AGMMS50293_18950 [Spirochaetia bacterium]|nr:hypothetical protein AGMMS50293_18950 [Spirochaetia bacterium]
MGKVVTEITLTNVMDKARVEDGVRSEVRQVTVDAVVDTGASTLIITEELRRQLGLEIEDARRTHFANGDETECGITGGVNIRWKNRNCICRAVVIPGAKSTLLGVIPLEDMDLIVNPITQTLEGAHGDVVVALAL